MRGDAVIRHDTMVRLQTAVVGSTATSTATPLSVAIDAAVAQARATMRDRKGAGSPELSAQIDRLADWWKTAGAERMADGIAPPPTIPRDLIDALRAGLLAHAAEGELESRDLVNALLALERLGDHWKRTVHGHFTSRLLGTDAVDAVVAIAHDIRSPLASILILVDSLRRVHRNRTRAIQDRQLGIIYGAAQGLGMLAADLMDIARERPLVQGNPVQFSVTESMEAVHSILRPMSEERGLAFALRPPVVDARVGYPVALQRVLLNLSSNAIRNTDQGSVSMECQELSVTEVRFSVTDTGRGLSSAQLDDLFIEPRDGRNALRLSRAGLGLAIVRVLLDAMQSTLVVDSQVGRGSRFSFQLSLPPVC